MEKTISEIANKFRSLTKREAIIFFREFMKSSSKEQTEEFCKYKFEDGIPMLRLIVELVANKE